MLMTPSLTSNLQAGYFGLGQEGIRHDLNRLFYNDLSRQGMIDASFYGAPYHPYAPSSYYQAPYYDPRYGRAFDYGYRPYDYARSFEYRPYDYSRGYEYGRSDYRPYDYARSFEYAPFYGFGRPNEYTRPYEAPRPELGYGRPYDAGMPYFRPVEGMIRPTEAALSMGNEPFTVPAVNSAETPDAYLLVIELPGVDLKDVNLQIHGSSLVLNAFRRPTWSNGTVTVNYHFAEGRFGTLRRVLPLPSGVLPGQIQANFVNGLLTIVLPKTVNGQSSIPQASIVINSNVPTTM